MAELGTLIPADAEDFFAHLIGEINCLGFRQTIEIIRKDTPSPAARKPTHEIIRVEQGERFKFGNAWLQLTKKAEEYLSLSIDDPTFASEMKLAAFKQKDHAIVSFRRKYNQTHPLDMW